MTNKTSSSILGLPKPKSGKSAPKPAQTRKPKTFLQRAVDVPSSFAEATTLDPVLPGLLARSLGVLVAPGGTGKSILSLQIAMSVAIGSDKFRIFTEGQTDQEVEYNPVPIKQGKVLLLNAEDPEEVIRSRLYGFRDQMPHEVQTLHQNLTILPMSGHDFKIAQKADYSAVSMAQDFGDLIEELKALAPENRPRLVILDTLNRLAGGVDENDNAQMGRVLNFVEIMNREIGCATLIIHHTNKGSTLTGQGGIQQAGRGASVVTDNARWQLNMSSMSKDEATKRGIDQAIARNWVQLDYSKTNYGPPRPQKWLYRTDNGILDGSYGKPKEPSQKPKKSAKDADC